MKELSDLFTPEPERWGLRGDVYLWRGISSSLRTEPIPQTVLDFLCLIEREFFRLCGKSIDSAEYFSVEAFAHGGMSSGGISPKFWRDTALPLLIQRFDILNNSSSPRGRATEKFLDKAIDAYFNRSSAFARWFLEKTRFPEAVARPVTTRSDHPWTTVDLSVTNPETGQPEVVRKDGETDVLLVFQNADGKRVALHIENKLASGRFTPFQRELYVARAKKWVGNTKYGAYTDWQIVLVAPREFVLRNEPEAAKFDLVVTHEDISGYIPDFRQCQN